MSGFDNDVVFALNADFTQADNQNVSESNGLISNGQIWIGATSTNAGGTHINVGHITSPLGTITIGYSSPNITIDLAGGAVAVEKFAMQTGTSPVVPTGGIVTFNGSRVAAGTNPVRTNGTGANTMQLEVQISQAIAATDATKIGLSAFDSASFSVDANGFVTAAGGGLIKTITGNTGGAEVPLAGNFNILGTGSITVAGSANTETVQLTGLTNHAIQIGAGTATLTQLAATATTGQILQNNASADPSWSTATYPSTTTVSQLLYSSATNVVSGLATANRGVLTTGATGVPVITALAADGQLIIGSTAGAPAAATLTAGAGISITNGSNSITIAASTGAFTWSETSGAFNAVKQNGYFITTTATATLPASPTEGDTIIFSVDTTNLLTITANTGQTIRLGNTVTAAAGTAVNTLQGDSINLVYKSTGTVWIALSSVGQWNLT
jgi:hypothetical protein